MFLFRFFGLTFLNDDVREIRRLRYANLLWIIINLSIFIFLVASPSAEIFSRNYSRMSEIIEIANYIFALLTISVVLVHVQLVNRKNEIWFQKLRQLDRLLFDKFDVQINHESAERWRFWKVVITFLCVVACSAVNVIFASHLEIGFVQLLYAHNYFLKVIINLRYLQHFTRIDFIKHRIMAFHAAVRKVSETNTVEWEFVLVLDVHNRRPLKPIGRIEDSNDVLVFMRLYATIFESMKLLENCFGWSLLAMILFTFIDLTSNLYWLIIAILKLDGEIQLIDCVIKILPSVMVISCLIYSSFDASRRAKEAVNSVSKLSTNTTSCYNHMIKEFQMQIRHQRIENSANDFFIVDFQLLSSVSKSEAKRTDCGRVV